VIVMSETAHKAFTEEQLAVLTKHGEICAFPINIIETIGGGSARCMVAEIFLPRRN